MINATISGNSAEGRWGSFAHGGGIYVDGDATLVNCTVAFNQASTNAFGAGLYANTSGGPTIKNCILADNKGPSSGNGPDIYGHVESQDYNLIESAGGYTLGGVTDHNVTGQDPDLGPLADNGGGTLTHALQPGSPAIDAGSCNDVAGDPITDDQRGVVRPQGIRCDIGAYEFPQPNLALNKTVDNALPQAGQRITYTITVENGGEQDATGAIISDTLPAGLTLGGPVVLDPSAAGTIGSPPRLVTGLTIVSGEVVSVTFPVTVSAGLSAGARITNTAAITSAEVLTPQIASRAIRVIDAPLSERVYLPLIVRNSP